LETPDGGEEGDPVDYEVRRKDHISHFILRLVYCKTECLPWETISKFLKMSEMHFEQILDIVRRSACTISAASFHA